MKQKHKLIKVCSSVLSKCVIASFFCFQVEACCERAITFVPKIIWRVTNGRSAFQHLVCEFPKVSCW